MVSTEINLPDNFVQGEADGNGGVKPGTAVNVLWRSRIGTRIYGNPTVAGGNVYVGTTGAGGTKLDYPNPRPVAGGRVLCLDEATGKLRWELSIPKTSKLRGKDSFLSQELSAGVCSSPAVDGNRVYVLTGNGLLLCLTTGGLATGNQGPFREEAKFYGGEDAAPVELLPTDADIVWVYDLIRELNVSIHDIASCSVLVHGPHLYLVTSNGVDSTHLKCSAPDAPSFIVVDKKTGRLVAVDDEKVGNRLLHCLWSSPSIGKVNGRELVFFGGGEGICYAFETPQATAGAAPVQTLKKVWSYDGVPSGHKMLGGMPANYLDGDVRNKRDNKNDGSYVGLNEIIGTPVFYRNRVYVAIGQDPAHGRGRGLLHCIDATGTGDITQSGCVWRFDGIERTVSGVAIAGGCLYATDIAGHVFCLDPDTGRQLWMVDLKAETWSTPLVADGKVYVPSAKGLHILAAGPTAKELARVKLDSPAYSSVVAADSTLFITTSRYLLAVKKGEGTQGLSEYHKSD